MPNKQEWIDYHKKVKEYLKRWEDHSRDVEKFKRSINNDGSTINDAPKPPIENPPPPPNPE